MISPQGGEGREKVGLSELVPPLIFIWGFYSYELVPGNSHSIAQPGDVNSWCGGALGGVDGEGKAPEMVGVAVLITGGGDGDASVGGGDAFGFAEVFAQLGVDGMFDALGLVEVHQAKGQELGGPHISDLRFAIVD